MPLTRRAALKALLAGAIGAGAGGITHGFAYERHALRLIQSDMVLAGLPEALEGVRIGFITDLHHSGFVSQAAVARAASLLMTQAPDAIVLGGDYVSNFDRRYMRPCAEALSSLRAPHGVFAVLGNHDDDRVMPAALQAQRFTVLKDARTSVLVRGTRLDLVGIRFWTREIAKIARLLDPAAPATVLLAHDPRRLVQAAQLAIPAVLSGHTHGGQIVLPGIGSLATRRFPVVAGGATREGTRIFVSRGVGTVLVPVRVNCPPEVAVLTLRRPAEQTDNREPDNRTGQTEQHIGVVGNT